MLDLTGAFVADDAYVRNADDEGCDEGEEEPPSQDDLHLVPLLQQLHVPRRYIRVRSALKYRV